MSSGPLSPPPPPPLPHTEDTDAYDTSGRYIVRLLPINDLPSLHATDEYKKGLITKIIYSNDATAGGDGSSSRMLSAFKTNDHPSTLTITGVPLSCWRGVLKNVPGSLPPHEGSENPTTSKSFENFRALRLGSFHVILVSLASSSFSPGPILVLQGLRYKGNIGAIIRTAVQANLFQSVVVIDPVYDANAKNNDRVEAKDVDYYSLMNAPLIDIIYMTDLSEFQSYANSTETNKNRKWLATHLNNSAINMFSPLASPHLLAAAHTSFVFLGSEGVGLPDEFIEDSRCTCMRIPSMSSSINVGAAAAMLIACISMQKLKVRE
ncbi:hypothetical protein TrVE_jg12651 [Triparma verrucosa]|uniref:tRNA/rRNA methyltransferase SpoU type domain-containing protein n=1 Tax=Triparma verrucosa TaxID=1606542 RepID=A0A9W7FBM7_9STRA|nr:hypothetical protein TrVE_jg12651 [Triparma verrucosa]